MIYIGVITHLLAIYECPGTSKHRFLSSQRRCRWFSEDSSEANQICFRRQEAVRKEVGEWDFIGDRDLYIQQWSVAPGWLGYCWWWTNYPVIYPSLQKSPKYLVTRCLEPRKAFSGGVCESKHRSSQGMTGRLGMGVIS